MTGLPKRLIEVDLPIKRISAHARREKSIRHGHISTLHIWWARRPLAACRAVILAALWPDPADPNCPERFRTEAANRMRAFRDKRGGKPRKWEDALELRAALLDFIADFSNWDNASDADYLETSRALVQVAHESLGGAPGTRPLVVDPFAGGGAIPLEALRVGADAFASDLNPVAVVLNKVVLEFIPKLGQRLADEVRRWGAWVKEQAEKELATFYPKDDDGATAIAYLWARTIKCEGPGCGAEFPLLRSLWLAKKKHRPVGIRLRPDHDTKRVDIEIIEGAQEVGEPTIRLGSATCPICGFSTPLSGVRRQLRDRRGGTRDARPFCIVYTKVGSIGRLYRSPNSKLETSVAGAATALQQLETRSAPSLSAVPDEPIPQLRIWKNNPIRVHLYGMETWGDLFTGRQALALATLAGQIRSVATKAQAEGCDKALADAIQTCLALALSRLVDRSCSLCTWRPQADQEKVEHVFSRQALSMTWDFAEGNPFSPGTACWEDAYEPPARLIEEVARSVQWAGRATCANATTHPLPADSAEAIITDPPYYDAIPYADLSDFFYVWLRRALPDSFHSEFARPETPKDPECVVDGGRGKDAAFFEATLAEALGEARRVVAPTGICTVVFAHKTTAGWEAAMNALVRAGWTVTASWPIDTELGNRLRAQNSAALASSVHLVCRPRDTDESARTDVLGDWRDVLAQLPKRIHEWMPRLASEGVVGADAIFACLGPALEVFSRHSRVEKASGDVVTLKEYLEHVWAAVAKEALTMIFAGAETSDFEEDARLTAMWLWTLSAGGEGSVTTEEPEGRDSDDTENDGGGTKSKPKGFVLEYDAARKIAQGLGAHLEGLTSLVEIKGETARLLPVAERTRALFGKAEGDAPPARRKKKDRQMSLGFAAELEEAEDAGGWGEKGAPERGKTVLDRVHQSMILFAASRGEALRRFLVDDGVGSDQRFWRLAQAFAALYPVGTDERRWVEGVLARKKGLGL